MIGNDIIDLELAAVQSNWKRKGFVEKIFTVFERLLIAEAPNSGRMVWILWSRKEAAYKIFNRQTQLRLYNPLDFECSALEYSAGFYVGTVNCRNNLYFTKTTVSTDFVHTVATTVAKDFKAIYELENDADILRKNNIPYLLDHSNGCEKPVSISHHGKFCKMVSLFN